MKRWQQLTLLIPVCLLLVGCAPIVGIGKGLVFSLVAAASVLSYFGFTEGRVEDRVITKGQRLDALATDAEAKILNGNSTVVSLSRSESSQDSGHVQVGRRV
jgi:hypothetical protein